MIIPAEQTGIASIQYLMPRRTAEAEQPARPFRATTTVNPSRAREIPARWVESQCSRRAPTHVVGKMLTGILLFG